MKCTENAGCNVFQSLTCTKVNRTHEDDESCQITGVPLKDRCQRYRAAILYLIHIKTVIFPPSTDERWPGG